MTRGYLLKAILEVWLTHLSSIYTTIYLLSLAFQAIWLAGLTFNSIALVPALPVGGGESNY